METFKTDRPNEILYVTKELFIDLMLSFIPIIIDLIFNLSIIKSSYYFIVFPGLIMRLVFNIIKNRLDEIIIDFNKKKVIFHYKSIFSRVKQKEIRFEECNIEISWYKPKLKLFKDSLTLYFLKDKMEIFEINQRKDGFSIEKLKQILETIKKTTLTI